jgi:hypothetical protein
MQVCEESGKPFVGRASMQRSYEGSSAGKIAKSAAMLRLLVETQGAAASRCFWLCVQAKTPASSR